MSVLDKIMGLTGVGSLLAEGSLYRKLLPRVVVIVILSVITGILSATVLILLAYLAYHVLTAHGLAPDAAIVFVGAIFVLVTIGFAFATHRALQRAKPNLLPLSGRLHSVVNAFVDGLREKGPQ